MEGRTDLSHDFQYAVYSMPLHPYPNPHSNSLLQHTNQFINTILSKNEHNQIFQRLIRAVNPNFLFLILFLLECAEEDGFCLTWRRVTTWPLLRSRSIVHFKAYWLHLSLSIATATSFFWAPPFAIFSLMSYSTNCDRFLCCYWCVLNPWTELRKIGENGVLIWEEGICEEDEIGMGIVNGVTKNFFMGYLFLSGFCWIFELEEKENKYEFLVYRMFWFVVVELLKRIGCCSFLSFIIFHVFIFIMLF